LPATYAGIETKIHTITNTTAISSKVSRSIPFENRDASTEIILGLFSAVSYNISAQLIVRFRIATLLARAGGYWVIVILIGLDFIVIGFRLMDYTPTYQRMKGV
jgi:hypothetical protein